MIPAAKTRRLVKTLKKFIASDALDTGQLSRCMTDAFGGTDASGAWNWRLALDLMQVAAGEAIRIDPANPQKTLAGITALMAGLPTETRRCERQLQLQQFSTPLDLSYVAAQAARICETDVVLEPSAGTGSLAVMASASSAKLHLNELDDQRRSLLAIVSGQAVTSHDAEFIADLIDQDVSPTVILMNPPFASSATRSDKTIAARHVLSAVKALRDGGRLVAIVPPSVSKTGDAGLWRRICAVATPVLRLHLPRAVFRKMGTSVSTDLLVLDKLPEGQGATCIEHSCNDLLETLTIVQDRCPKRSDPVTPAPSKSGPAASKRVPKPVGGRKMLLPGRSSVDTNALAPIDFEIFFEPRTNAPVSDVYADYAPSVFRSRAHRIIRRHLSKALRWDRSTRHAHRQMASSSRKSWLKKVCCQRRSWRLC